MKTYPPTQGPWRCWSRLILDEHDNVLAAGESRKRLIDQRRIEDINGRDEHVVDPVTADRNAFLMSKAPEMFDVLERIVDWIDVGCDPSRRTVEEAHALLSVIRKDQQ